MLDIAKINENLKRTAPGHTAFCATIDLLGSRSMLVNNPDELADRLNELQQGLGPALLKFPGGENYRVCLAGDCIFAVREIGPEQDWKLNWPRFCGHIFALATELQGLERILGNPGIRLILSFGELVPLWDINHWNEKYLAQFTENWFVLTGVSVALNKCFEAEKLGSNGGFDPGYAWHEEMESPCSYNGTNFASIPGINQQGPEQYADIYKSMVAKATRKASLNCAPTDSKRRQKRGRNRSHREN